MGKSIRDLLLEYYKRHPKEECQHGPVVDWVEKQYLRLYGKNTTLSCFSPHLLEINLASSKVLL